MIKKILFFTILCFIIYNLMSQPSSNLTFRYKGLNDLGDSSLIDSISGQKLYLYQFYGDLKQGDIDLKSDGYLIINTDTLPLKCLNFPNYNNDSLIYFKIENGRLTKLSIYSIATDANNYFNTPNLGVNCSFVDTSNDYDYTSIVTAIAAASTGDTIVIRSGTYNENYNATYGVYFNKSLTLLGVGNSRVITNGSEIIRTISTYNKYIKGLQFNDDGTTYGIRITASSVNNYIDNCLIKNSTFAQVYPGGSSETDINNCSVSGGTYGIYNSGRTDVDSCAFNGIGQNVSYNDISSTDTTIIENCIFYNSDGLQYILLRSDQVHIARYNNFYVDNTGLDNTIASQVNNQANFQSYDNNFIVSEPNDQQLIAFLGSGANFQLNMVKDSIWINTNSYNQGIIQIDDIENPVFDSLYFENFYSSNNVIRPIVASSTGELCDSGQITNCTFIHLSDRGYFIIIGNEVSGVWDNKLHAWNISNNVFQGIGDFTDTLTVFDNHTILYGHSKNPILRNNKLTGCGLGFVLKSDSLVYDNEDISGNYIWNTRIPFRIKGSVDVSVTDNFIGGFDYIQANIVNITNNGAGTTGSGANILRNIIYDPYGAFNFVSVEAGSQTNFVTNYNILMGSPDFIETINGVNYSDLNTLQGAGYEINSIKLE
jgi:hypothetical protein